MLRRHFRRLCYIGENILRFTEIIHDIHNGRFSYRGRECIQFFSESCTNITEVFVVNVWLLYILLDSLEVLWEEFVTPWRKRIRISEERKWFHTRNKVMNDGNYFFFLVSHLPIQKALSIFSPWVRVYLFPHWWGDSIFEEDHSETRPSNRKWVHHLWIERAVDRAYLRPRWACSLSAWW